MPDVIVDVTVTVPVELKVNLSQLARDNRDVYDADMMPLFLDWERGACFLDRVLGDAGRSAGSDYYMPAVDDVRPQMSELDFRWNEELAAQLEDSLVVD